MAQVTAELPDFSTPGGNAARIRFQNTTAGLVDATSLRTLAGDAIVTRLQINADQGRCFMQIVAVLGDTPADPNPSLSSAWELHIPAITLRATGLSDIGISGPNAASNDVQDTSEPYTWEPGTANADYAGGLDQWVEDFKAAVRSRPDAPRHPDPRRWGGGRSGLRGQHRRRHLRHGRDGHRQRHGAGSERQPDAHLRGGRRSTRRG